MKLYENIVIGNFLYGLGAAVQARLQSKAILSSINLLQQTPMDKSLGDVLLEFPGVMRIIEFKQKNNKSGKEERRLHQLRTALRNKPRLIEISRVCHWFIETAQTEQSYVTRIVPYLDAYPRDENQHDFNQFINSIADDAVKGQSVFSIDDIRLYLAFVASCHGAGDVTSGGLIMAITAEGTLRYSQLTSMMQLRLQHKEYVNEILASMEKSIPNEYQQEKSRDKPQDWSLGLGD